MQGSGVGPSANTRSHAQTEFATSGRSTDDTESVRSAGRRTDGPDRMTVDDDLQVINEEEMLQHPSININNLNNNTQPDVQIRLR